MAINCSRYRLGTVKQCTGAPATKKLLESSSECQDGQKIVCFDAPFQRANGALPLSEWGCFLSLSQYPVLSVVRKCIRDPNPISAGKIPFFADSVPPSSEAHYAITEHVAV